MKKVLISCLAVLSALTFNAYAQEDLTVEMLANQADTQAAFKQMTANHALPAWVTEGGTYSPAQSVEFQGKKYLVLNACKPHDCGTERIAVLYSPDEKRMSGVLSVLAENESSEKLTWLNISDSESIDGKTILFASLTGSLENHPESFNFN